MTDYAHDMQLVVDPLNPSNVVRDGAVWLYDPSDLAGTTPIAITDPNGMPLTNPLQSNSYGFTPPFIAQIPAVKWKSGTFEGFFYSYKGLRDEAIAAVAAAEAAGVTAAAEAAEGVADVVADAATAATAATSAATSAAASAALVGAPADAAIAAAVNGNGATKAALSAAYEQKGAAAPKLDLLSKLVAPVYISHRGGPLRFPEHSMEGYRESARTGFLPELDIQALADGTLVMLHDTTTGRTMTGTSAAVNTLTRDQWLSRRVKPAIPGGKYAMPVFWDDVLNEFGGRIVLVPEIKATNLTVANKVIDSIVERGLQKSILVQSFDWDACLLSVAAGIETLYLTDATPSASWLAAGVKYIGAFTGWGAGHFTTLKNMGYKTIPYTVNTRADANTFNGVNVWGMFSDDPWAVSGRYPERRRDPFAEEVKWIGSDGADATLDSLVPLADGSTALQLRCPAAALRTVEQGWAGAVPAKSFSMEFSMTFGAEGLGSHSGRFYLSDVLNKKADEAHQNWILVSVRRNGQVLMYKRTASGSTVTMTSATWAGLTLADGVAGTPKRFRYSVNATGDVTFTCLDTADAPLTALDAAAQLGTAPKWLSFASTGADVKFSKVALTY